jgi:hypothetical protein
MKIYIYIYLLYIHYIQNIFLFPKDASMPSYLVKLPQ